MVRTLEQKDWHAQGYTFHQHKLIEIWNPGDNLLVCSIDARGKCYTIDTPQEKLDSSISLKSWRGDR